MHILPDYQRIALLTDGHLGVFTAKTAASLLRYRPNDVVAVIDAQAAGQDLRAIIPWAPATPILPDVPTCAPLDPQALFIGVSPPGGALPSALRRHVQAALDAGIDVVNGLHEWLADDPDLARRAAAGACRIHDLRRPPTDRSLASGAARETRARRVLTVGSDGNVGKMVAALELTAAACRRGLDARFLATGQTGVMISGRGIAIDAVVSDFAPGAAEHLVLSAADCDLCVIEGQGSLAHPGFSAVTLALLHGTCPDALIFVHHVGRSHHRVQPDRPIPPLRELRAAYEQLASLLHPCRVVGVVLNTQGADPWTVYAETRRLRQELRVPVCTAFDGALEPIVDTVLAACDLKAPQEPR